jgi:hypothetical protein
MTTAGVYDLLSSINTETSSIEFLSLKVCFLVYFDVRRMNFKNIHSN